MDNTVNHDEASTHLSLSPPHASAPLSSVLSPNRTMTPPANARWVPTREQLVVLEGLYNQGMRIPTFEEILQVTARLKEHGPIEAKNVFYWFQNQKVRQFHRPQPLPVAHRPPGHPFSPVQLQAPSAPNTPSCNREAMYMQQTCYPAAQAAANAAYYMQAYGNIQTQSSSAMYYQAVDQNNTNTQQPRALSFPHANNNYIASDTYYRRPVTLNLFPQYPTFANRHKERHTGSSAGSARPSTSGSLSCHVESPEVPAAMPQSHSMTSLMKDTEDKH